MQALIQAVDKAIRRWGFETCLACDLMSGAKC